MQELLETEIFSGDIEEGMFGDTNLSMDSCTSDVAITDSPERIDVESCTSSSEAGSYKWKTIGRVDLLDSDKAILRSPDRWITGNIINASQHLLKEKFTSLSGFQDTISVKSKRVALAEGEFIQILHKEDSHWITVSNIATGETGAVCIYDSLNDYNVPFAMKRIIAGLIISKKPCIPLRQEDVPLQGDFTSCGLFAIAFATSLCFGQDPRRLIFDKASMRRHLLECLEKSEMRPFPVQGYRSPAMGRLESFRIYCKCRMPHNPSDADDFLRCHLCGKKYHPLCDDDSKLHWKQSDDVQYWLCSECWPLAETKGFIITSIKDRK